MAAPRDDVMANDDYDVVVVGGGGAGLAAAIEARERGATVLLLEKNPKLGGSTAWSIGSVSSSQTPHQRAKGIDDNPGDHWADMPGFAGDLDSRDNAELRRVLCDEIPDTFQWLLDSGVRFMGPMPEPPHRQPRMHNVLPNSRSFIYHLERRARRAGVEIRTQTTVTELVVTAGRVNGVKVRSSNLPGTLYARGGVVLAAGDFTNDPGFKARFMGAQKAKVEGVNVTATGDGQRLAEALGATIINGDLALGPELRFIAPAKETLVRRLPPWRWLAMLMQWSMEHVPDFILRPFLMKFLTTALAPSRSLFDDGAVLVNRNGERFCEEKDDPALALPDQPGREGYIILNDALAKRYESWPNFISTAPGVAYAYIADYRRNRGDIYAEASSASDLARRLGMDPAALERSIAMLPLGTSGGTRYVALGPVRAVFVHAEGGLKVDLRHCVLDADNKPIPGLYAAGSTGQGGLLLKGHGHHLAWAFVSGRRAGRLAALDAADPTGAARRRSTNGATEPTMN